MSFLILRYILINTYRFICTYIHTHTPNTHSHEYLFILIKCHLGWSFQIHSKPKQVHTVGHLFYSVILAPVSITRTNQLKLKRRTQWLHVEVCLDAQNVDFPALEIVRKKSCQVLIRNVEEGVQRGLAQMVWWCFFHS